MNILKTPIYIIAKKELMDNIRNKWIIVISALFTALVLLASFGGSYWKDFELTISALSSIVYFIIPIIGLMLGYASIIGEIERGSMNSLLAHPLKRVEVVIGKFLGNATVLSLSILIGFGIAGIVISLNTSNPNYGLYLLFIAVSILLGLVFLSLSMCFSAFLKRRSLSMGVSILFYFLLTIIWSFFSSIILVTANSMEDLQAGNITFPDSYFAVNMVNPVTAYSGVIELNLAPGRSGILTGYPSFYNVGLLLLSIFIWLVIPLILSSIQFNRKDV
jgi:ABC-type transport system involved in multi-copper enzyme maturation permease subunit